MEDYLLATLLGVIAGTTGRYFMLQSDYRQYPAYPHGMITHLSLGFIAAVLGSVAIPALAEQEFTAVTFLALAATQFRDIREIERNTLTHLDKTELVSRGPDYIEGIARVFESRNYLVILISILVSGFSYYVTQAAGTLLAGLAVGIAIAVPAIILSSNFMKGKQLWQIARIRIAEPRFDKANLFVEDIHFMNLGTAETKETILERGLGVIIEPFDDNARETLANRGQRMAIAHEAAAQMGVYRDVDTAEYMPIVRRDLDTGRIGLIILPIEKDPEFLKLAVERVPVLESALSSPLQSRAGRKAAD